MRELTLADERDAGGGGGRAGPGDAGAHLTKRVYNVVWHKSIPAQIRPLILYNSDNAG